MSKIAVLAPLAAAALSVTAFVPSASAEPGDVGVAAHYDGKCDGGEVCLFYNSNAKGSFADFAQPISDFAGARFRSDGAGKNQVVKNNAASACNKNKVYYAVIFFNSNHEGPNDAIPPGKCANLTDTYNENASFTWAKLG